MGSIIQLFRSYKNSKEQFTRLLAPHVELMYRMAYRWTHSQEDAEDLVQDVLMKLAYRVDEMLNVEQLRPWLIKVLYHRFVDLYRSKQSSPVIQLHDFQAPDSDAPHNYGHSFDTGQCAEDRLQLQQTLDEALDTLDNDQRDVVLLHMVEGYTALEVAEILEVNVGTVKSRLQRARTKLKKFLQTGPF